MPRRGLIGEERRPSYNYWLTRDSHAMKKAMRTRYKYACQHISGLVYDMACGWGFGTNILADHCRYAIGIDADKEAIDFVKGYNPRANVEYHVQDLEKWMPESHCDWVVTLETIEHLKDPIGFLKRCRDIAEVGVVVSAPIGVKKPKNPFHITDVTHEMIDDTLGCGGWRNTNLEVMEHRREDKPNLPLGTVYVYQAPAHLSYSI